MHATAFRTGHCAGAARAPYAGVDVNYTNSVDGLAFAGKKTSYLVGGGLSLNKDGSYGLNTTIGTTLSDDTRLFQSIGANQNSQLMWDKDGKYTGGNQNIDLTMKFQTSAAARKNVQELLKNPNLSAEERTALQNQLANLNGGEASKNFLIHNRQNMERALGIEPGTLSDEDFQKILNGTHPTIKFEDAVKATALLENKEGRLKTAESRGFFGELFGNVLDPLKMLLLNEYSDDLGYIDPTTGEWTARTCFAAGTLVAVAPYTSGAFEKNGKYYKEIQDIRQGDSVSAWDEVTGGLTYSKVLHTFVRKSSSVFRVHLENGKTLDTTWSHPFYVADIGWVKATNLHPGMWLPTRSGIVHYNESLAMSGGHGLPLQAVSFGSKSGRNTGTVLLKSDLAGAVRIVGVEEIPVGETVYNFSVAENHNYFVGEESVLVHNESNYLMDTLRDGYQNANFVYQVLDIVSRGRLSNFLCGEDPKCKWTPEETDRYNRIRAGFNEKYRGIVAGMGATCGFTMGAMCDDARTFLTEKGVITPEMSELDAQAYVDEFNDLYTYGRVIQTMAEFGTGGVRNPGSPARPNTGMEPVLAGGPRIGTPAAEPPTKGGPTSFAQGSGKPMNLPGHRDVELDMVHVASGHIKGGSRVSTNKDLFPETMNKEQVNAAIKDAYKNVTKRLATQGDRVLVRGFSQKYKMEIEMWINTKTKIIETAYPK